MVKYLVEKGADANKGAYSPLSITCSIGKEIKIVRYLVENGATINVKESYNKTPLHFACIGGNLNLVKYLVENEAEINAVSEDEGTPLNLAEKHNHVPVFQYLTSKGGKQVSVNKKKKETSSSLYDTWPSFRNYDDEDYYSVDAGNGYRVKVRYKKPKYH